jgi:hypothetical protein
MGGEFHGKSALITGVASAASFSVEPSDHKPRCDSNFESARSAGPEETVLDLHQRSKVNRVGAKSSTMRSP